MRSRIPTPVPIRLWALPLLVLLWPGSLSCEPEPAGGPLRHVVLISCDTLSALHLVSCGYDRPTTNSFDELAGHGVLFRHCLTPQGWTLSSHMSMFTGLSPGVHRVGKYRALPAGVPLLAETLHAAGFRTGAFVTSNEWLDQRYGFARGFEVYHMCRLSDPSVEQAVRWADETIAARQGSREPFFEFLHYMDVHSRPAVFPCPYWPLQEPALQLCDLLVHRREPKRLLPVEVDDLFGDIRNWDLARYDHEFLRCSYDACVTAWDEFRLRRLLTGLDGAGLLDDALVIITSDHGEQLGEHGDYLHDDPYAEVRRVPLLMIWPGHLPAGVVIDQPVSLLDLTPTILDLAGLPAPEPCQGISLRPVLEDPRAVLPSRAFLVEGLRPGWRLTLAALVTRHAGRWWSVVASLDTAGTTSTFQPARVEDVVGLYDLAADPLERDDLSRSQPDVAALLRQRLQARLGEEAALAGVVATDSTATYEVEIPDEVKRKLRSLGY
jgi:arylsulfatase A-like enzyme